ncbi:hypothetical protein B0H34DRAFT_779869 [Crassisporium funariophilum]|nr:hypothetical protein B0H34DRAFT_779869 [Crassisporium funariophilum]
MNREMTVFLLGATGYLGSQFLVLLGRKRLPLYIVALVRNVTVEKEAKLKAIYGNLTIVEGSLDDAETIQDQASKAKYVINCANSDHVGSVEAILKGLENQSAANPGDPPLYIHVSGLCIVNNNTRGEYVEPEKITEYTDVGFSLDQCPPTNPHQDCDKLIAAAGVRQESPVRTILAYPGWIFGVGEGITKTTGAIRAFLPVFSQAGYAGTWGPGYGSLSNIHVKDCAAGLVTIFEAALEGKADEGAEGYYFIASDAPYVPHREITAVIGDTMFSKGAYTQGGSKPLPSTITDALGEFGWILMGGSHRVNPQRLKKLGWEATETKKKSLLESLTEELELAT